MILTRANATLREGPGGSLVFFNPFDVRSHALGQVRKLRLDYHDPPERLLDDPHCHNSRWSWVQSGGPWYRHVSMKLARREGRHDDADREMATLRVEVAAMLAAR